MNRLKLFGKKPAQKHITPPPLIQEKKPASATAVKFAQGTKTESTFRGPMKPPLRHALQRPPRNTSNDELQNMLDQLIAAIDEPNPAPLDKKPGAAPQGPSHRSQLPASQRSAAASRHVQAVAKDVDPADLRWLERLANADSPEKRLQIMNEDSPLALHPVGEETKYFENRARTRKPATNARGA